MSDVFELSMEEVRKRMAAANVEIAEERLKLVRSLLNDGLAPIRRMSASLRAEDEPAPRFQSHSLDC